VIPDVVTHYHLGSRPPFLNLSDLPPDRLADVLADLHRERTDGLSARVFGRRYMELRRRTEEKLLSLFLKAGGKPERTSPHYFVLGTSSWYEGLAPDMAAFVVPLTDLPTEATSLTIPDSFTSMGFGPDYGLPREDRPYHGRVYRLEDLPALVSAYGLPADDASGPDGSPDDSYDGYQLRPFEKYIEVQLWSDRPLAPYGIEASGS
jgi:hypothetical protein